MRPALGAAILCAATVSLGIASGCQQILDVPSDSVAIAEAVRRTCQCTPLEIQQADFAARCDAALDQLVELSSDDEVAKAALLQLGELSCDQCSQVEVCYAEIVSASADGEGCIASSECAGWACCQGELEVEGIGDRIELDTVQNEPVCCAPAEGAGSACVGCSTAADQISDGTDPFVCAEAFTLLSSLVECFKDDGLSGCLDDCANLIGDGRYTCFACLYQRALAEDSVSLCIAEAQQCEADAIDRPNIVGP